MGFLFNNHKNSNRFEKTALDKIINVDRLITREATFRILNTAIIYNAEEEYYYSVATCVSENNEIETISIEGFDIHENIIELRGAYIDYEEYEEYSKVNYTGTIYNL